MADKKKPAKQSQRDRLPVQLPADWGKLVTSRAADFRQPVLWYLLSLIAADADKAGVKRPSLPWEPDKG